MFIEQVSQQVWDLKYRYYQNGKPVDQSIEQTWQRVAKAIAQAEPMKERKHWQQKFYELLANFNFLPGGRILAGAGVDRKVTLFNCFVMDIAKDSLIGIFDALKEGALTLQQGGGVGYDFSILRPHGAATEKTGSIASGPVSFMRIWDAMSATMQSSGSRRGAMMGTLRCDHPDIEEFIAVKSSSSELRHFNISVLVTDEFMQAVKNNAEWELVFPVSDSDGSSAKTIKRRWSGSSKQVVCKVVRTVKARELWKKIIKAAYDYAEPGVLFEDTINRLNPLGYAEWISATNPCGEIPLPAYGACNLGSINLVNFIKQPFSSAAQIDWQALDNLTAIATRFLDNVISISKFPLTAQKQEVLHTRRIGLGFTGLADALVMLGLRYGSKPSLQVAKEFMQRIAMVTWETSALLAKERGNFPLFKKQKYLSGEFVTNLPEALRQQIQRYGMRNSHHNAIAPTGTISLLANNVSNGLEPVFAPSYTRHMRKPNGDLIQLTVQDYAYRLWQQKNDKDSLPPNWVDAHQLQPEDHLQMQAAIQPFVDNAISKTINLPKDFPFEQLEQVYSKAYNLGLKGCTIFRPNPVTGSILSTNEIDQCCPTK